MVNRARGHVCVCISVRLFGMRTRITPILEVGCVQFLDENADRDSMGPPRLVGVNDHAR